MLRKIIKFVVIPLSILIILGSLCMLFFAPKLQYSEVVNLFKAQKIETYDLNVSNGHLKYKVKGETSWKKYTIPDTKLFTDDIKNTSKDIKYNYSKNISFGTALSVLQTVIFIGLAFLFFLLFAGKVGIGVGGASEQGQRSRFGFGKSKISTTATEVTFDDVAGADEEKYELQEVVSFLKSPEKFTKLGAKIPHGVLLVGPPGTGKTLIAKAVAGEAEVPFYSMSGSDFVELYVGVGASRVRDLFEQAKKSAPSIIFIDEIDAVGKARNNNGSGSNQEQEQTLNQLLVEMDGFGAQSNVIVIAATNRAELLDKALLRPGRFDRQVVVNLPDAKGREEILKVHAKNKPLADDISLESIAKDTAGFSGAELANILNEGALLAARAGKEKIYKEHIDDALLKVSLGIEKKSGLRNMKDKKITAYHEIGHAVISCAIPGSAPVNQVSIIPRGNAAGFTSYTQNENSMHLSRHRMLDKICELLGGRAAEAVCLDDICTGASNDIERASSLANDMVTKYGFCDEFGPIKIERTEADNKRINAEVENIIKKQYNRALTIIEANKEKITEISERLIAEEKIDGTDIVSFFGFSN